MTIWIPWDPVSIGSFEWKDPNPFPAHTPSVIFTGLQLVMTTTSLRVPGIGCILLSYTHAIIDEPWWDLTQAMTVDGSSCFLIASDTPDHDVVFLLLNSGDLILANQERCPKWVLKGISNQCRNYIQFKDMNTQGLLLLFTDNFNLSLIFN